MITRVLTECCACCWWYSIANVNGQKDGQDVSKPAETSLTCHSNHLDHDVLILELHHTTMAASVGEHEAAVPASPVRVYICVCLPVFIMLLVFPCCWLDSSHCWCAHTGGGDTVRQWCHGATVAGTTRAA